MILNQAYNHIINAKMEETYIDYFGQSIGDVKIFLSPDSKYGYGCKNVYEDRVTLMPTLSVSPNEKNLLYFLLHEIGHSYINPQNELRPEAVNELAYLYEPIKEQMAKQAYSNWETVLIEHIVRASVIDMMEIIYGEDVVDDLIEEEMVKKFDYIKEIINLLDEYKNNIERYYNFDLYFDQLLEGLKVIKL